MVKSIKAWFTKISEHPSFLNQNKRIINLYTVGAFLSSGLIFFLIIWLGLSSDTQNHSVLLTKYLARSSFPVPPLYYFTIYLFSGFSQHIELLNYVAVLALSVAVGIKYRATVSVLLHNENKSGLKAKLAPAGAFLLLFSAPLLYDFWSNMYLGKLATSVWHNSTTIFVMPFVILLFYISIRTFSAHKITSKDFGYILALGVLVLLIKPSFLFAYIPVFSLMSLVFFGWRSPSFHLALLSTTLLFVGVLIQYYLIYLQDPSGVSMGKEQSGITIAPFEFYRMYSQNILLDILVSIAYPVTCILLYGKQLIKKRDFQFGLYLFIVAWLIGNLLSETGVRAGHGNFTWQIIMCNYLLFVTTLKFHLDQISKLGFKQRKVRILTFIFLLHIVSGVVYVFKYLITGDYL